ncbi:single-stranded DNA-binding protein [Faecalicatena sp. AGMB00832]|uniref:Single-stranded DNA-binding protein n=1 Tax=Faecalicatena faecalis TaxID=2726362 RepID=A0ABS6D260_9FIRM|nr:single-stranded DNA-binding protein [Faecalicatena faecalis]MBU3875677.1 single-stranded DNA-binding protein [Faecalicatena faecalis]
MNKVILLGRLTRDPEVRWGQKKNSQEQLCIVRFSLAVDRRGRDAGADFVSCVIFGKSAESAEKYLHKGSKIAVSGRIQTGSYTNEGGQRVNTTDVVIEEWEFAESKAAAGQQAQAEQPDNGDGFMNIPDGIEDQLPFD